MMNETTSTDELLALLKAQQDEAWRFLYARWMCMLCPYGVRQGLALEDAEEVAHDTLLQVAKCIHTYEENRASGVSWIWSIHKNKVIDRLRRKRAVEFEELTDVYPCTDKDTPERYVENSLLRQAMIGAWTRLPEWAKKELRLDRGPGRRGQGWHDARALFRTLLEEEEER